MGSEYQPDDNGLPPVDIDIPDDARELDRDVQAYHRELRARQARERRQRLLRAVRRYGMTAPLIAGVMLIAAASAAMLILSSRAGTPEPNSRDTSAGDVGKPLPDIRLMIDNRTTTLRKLHPAVLAVIPANCDCVGALRHLTTESRRYGVPVYLLGAGPTRSTATTSRQHTRLQGLAELLSERQRPSVIDDSSGIVANAYGIRGSAAVLVGRDGDVHTVVRDLAPGTELEAQLAPLVGR